jgi:hypothetical protein
LHDGSCAGVQIALDRGEQCRRFHSSDQVIEESLLVAFEGAPGGGFRLAIQGTGVARDIHGFQRRLEILVNDLEGMSVGIVDADLFRSQRMLDDLDFDAFVRQRACGIKSERFQIASEDFHGGNAAGLYGCDKVCAVGERKIGTAP